jgi:hypothetical protein
LNSERVDVSRQGRVERARRRWMGKAQGTRREIDRQKEGISGNKAGAYNGQTNNKQDGGRCCRPAATLIWLKVIMWPGYLRDKDVVLRDWRGERRWLGT